MLKIVKETDVIKVENLITCIYGAPGLGKTSLGFTASRPLLLDFDAGAYRSAFRKDSVQVSAWSDVEDMSAQDLVNYDTIVIDTAGRALDTLSAQLMEKNPKFKGFGGALSLQGYGALKSTFTAWLKKIRGFGKDIVLIAHMDEQRSGDETVERLDVQGGSKAEIYKVADAMGRLYMDKTRKLNFSPSDTAFGKNPGGLPVLDVPHFAERPTFLADVIQKTKDSLNRLSEAQQKAAAELAEYAAKFEAATTPDEFNALMPECGKASAVPVDNVKRLLVKAAKAKGVTFDQSSKSFKAA